MSLSTDVLALLLLIVINVATITAFIVATRSKVMALEDRIENLESHKVAERLVAIETSMEGIESSLAEIKGLLQSALSNGRG